MNLKKYKNQSSKLQPWSVILQANEVDVSVYSEYALVKVNGYDWNYITFPDDNGFLYTTDWDWKRKSSCVFQLNFDPF